MRNWLLPEYIEDVLPTEAAQIESLRRSLVDWEFAFSVILYLFGF